MKRTLAILLALVMVMALAACGTAETAATEAPATEAAATEAPAAETAATEAPAASSTAEAGKTDGIVIGIANGYYGNTWRAQMVSGMEDVCKKYVASGVVSNYIITNCTGDTTEELNNINSLISENVDILLISTNSPNSLGGVIDSALAQGIQVILFNEPCAYEGTIDVVFDDQTFWGIQAKWFASKLDGKGNLVQIGGVAGSNTAATREASAAKVFADYPDIKILANAPGDWSETTAQSVMSTFIATYGDQIDGVMIEDVMANGVVRAYENAGIAFPKYMSGDTSKSFIDWNVENPDVNTITTMQPPSIGANALEIAIRLYQGHELADGVLIPNSEDESIVNMIKLDMPLCLVSNPDDLTGPWTEGQDNTTFMTMEDAAKMVADKEDSYMIDLPYTDAQIDALFK